MPLPWKKNNVTRISQIVADLQTPKHGGSLVVETGFPTSLIDLFVKNRSRFKKRKSKKQLPLEISDPLPPATPPAPPPSPPTPSSSTASFEVSAEPRRLVRETVHEDDGVAGSGPVIFRFSECGSGSDPVTSATPSNSTRCLEISADTRYSEAQSLNLLARETVHEDDGIANSGRVLNRVGECSGTRLDSNIVLAAILKIFAVVVLISSMKKLTVGITVSAFVLLFFEYVGKHVVRYLNLKPCPDANEAFRSLAQRVSCSFWFQKIAIQRMNHCEASEQDAIVHEEAVISCSDSSSIEEIKVVQAKSETDIHCELNSLNVDKKWVCPKMEDDSTRKVVEQCIISGRTIKGKRSAKLKSKMMKIFVPKKLRALKKESKEKKRKDREAESSSEASSTVEGDKSARFETEEQESRKTTLERIKDEEAEYGIACSIEEGRTDSARSSGYIILILIALAGLVGGRILALIFTVACCFMLKMVNTRGRSDKLPLINVSLYQSTGRKSSGVW